MLDTILPKDPAILGACPRGQEILPCNKEGNVYSHPIQSGKRETTHQPRASQEKETIFLRQTHVAGKRNISHDLHEFQDSALVETLTRASWQGRRQLGYGVGLRHQQKAGRHHPLATEMS